MTHTSQVTLVIADPRPLAARSLAGAFGDEDDFVVQASCHDDSQLVSILASGDPIDAVVVDAEMFDDDASVAVAAIRQLQPGAAVLLLMTRIDAPLLDALAQDRVSCVSAYSEAHQIISAIRALLTGRTLLPSRVQRALMKMLSQSASPPSPLLTLREEQVLELAANGLTVPQIAARLNVSSSTAKTHLLRVYEKLDAPNRSAAVANALARGMLRAPPQLDERLRLVRGRSASR
jgi:DNA-binding NarL/FixJ family response regulator